MLTSNFSCSTVFLASAILAMLLDILDCGFQTFMSTTQGQSCISHWVTGSGAAFTLSHCHTVTVTKHLSTCTPVDCHLNLSSKFEQYKCFLMNCYCLIKTISCLCRLTWRGEPSWSSWAFWLRIFNRYYKQGSIRFGQAELIDINLIHKIIFL